MDSLTSPSHSENKQTNLTADMKDGENDSEKHEEASPREENHAQSDLSEQDQENLNTAQDTKDEEADRDSVTESSVNNRFTVLSEQQHTVNSSVDDDIDQEEEDDTELVSKMEKVNLDDAFMEDSDAAEQVWENENEPPEAKEYTVVNEEPELAFHTLATRTAPEKQECSVRSCLFQFTEVETLTQSNSLLCVTCTKRQPNKDKAQGTGIFFIIILFFILCQLSRMDPVILTRQNSQSQFT